MTGIVAAIPYAFIFPPALYLKLDPNASMVHSGKVLAVLQLAFGVVFFVLGLTGRVICLVKNTTFCRSSQKEKDNHQSLQCYHGNHGNIVTMHGNHGNQGNYGKHGNYGKNSDTHHPQAAF